MNTKFGLKNLKIGFLGDLKHRQEDGIKWILKKWCEVISMYYWHRTGLSGGLLRTGYRTVVFYVQSEFSDHHRNCQLFNSAPVVCVSELSNKLQYFL